MSQANFQKYAKYEQYSLQYFISLEQIDELSKKVTEQKSIDHLIAEHCYYNIASNMVNDFTQKLKHNIKLAQEKDDREFLNYLQYKFQIKEDLGLVDVDKWIYMPKKITLKLKSSLNLNTEVSGENKRMYNIKKPLADFLEVSADKIFKYKSEIYRLVHEYIYDTGLQDKNCRINIMISKDEELSNLLLPLEDHDQEYTYFNLAHYLRHLIV